MLRHCGEQKAKMLYSSSIVHKVHFAFWLHEGVWCYQFTGDGVRKVGPLRKTYHSEKLRGLAERGGGLPNLEANLMFDYAVQSGKGGMYLKLTDAQYKALGGD